MRYVYNRATTSVDPSGLQAPQEGQPSGRVYPSDFVGPIPFGAAQHGKQLPKSAPQFFAIPAVDFEKFLSKGIKGTSSAAKTPAILDVPYSKRYLLLSDREFEIAYLSQKTAYDNYHAFRPVEKLPSLWDIFFGSGSKDNNSAMPRKIYVESPEKRAYLKEHKYEINEYSLMLKERAEYKRLSGLMSEDKRQAMGLGQIGNGRYGPIPEVIRFNEYSNFLPIIGQLQEADWAFREGDWVFGVFHVGMAAMDVFLVKDVAVGTGKMTIRAIGTLSQSRPVAGQAVREIGGAFGIQIDAGRQVVPVGGTMQFGGRSHSSSEIVANAQRSVQARLSQGGLTALETQRLTDISRRLSLEVVGATSCFVAGTMLLTPDGEQPIETFREGDRILSRAEHDPAGPVEVKTVEETFVRQSRIMSLRVRGREIRTTFEHPFYVEGKGWICANEVEIGDRFSSHDGQWVTVEAVTELDEVATVYNLRVSDYHTYFVGSREWGSSVWAHNSCYEIRRMANGQFGLYEIATGNPVMLTRNGATSHVTGATADIVRRAGLEIPQVSAGGITRAIAPMADRPGMAITFRELPGGRRVGFIGEIEANAAASQAPALRTQFEAMINSGEYELVIRERSLRRALGWEELGLAAGDVGQLRPDIIGIRSNGLIDVIEVVSQSQSNPAGRAALQAKLNRIRDAIPANQRGTFRLIDPFE